jgi:hypothetical protein
MSNFPRRNFVLRQSDSCAFANIVARNAAFLANIHHVLTITAELL